MNERIVKLFMQSVDTNYIPLPIEDHIPLWTEKFAELIVRECEVALSPMLRDMVSRGQAYDLIKKHFGVE